MVTTEAGRVRVQIFVDASNFYISFGDWFDQKAHLVDVDWRRFGEHLCALVGGTEWQLMYFVGVPPEDDLMNRQLEPRRSSATFAAIRAVGGEVYPGLLLRTEALARKVGEPAHKEKMVDTGAATLIADGAATDEYDVGVVVSADMDFVPPVKLAATRRGKVMHVFHLNERSLADRTRQLYTNIHRVSLHSLEEHIPVFMRQIRIMPQRRVLDFDQFAMWAATWIAQHTRGARSVIDVEHTYLLNEVQFPGLPRDSETRYKLLSQLLGAGLLERYPIQPGNRTGIRIAEATERFMPQQGRLL